MNENKELEQIKLQGYLSLDDFRRLQNSFKKIFKTKDIAIKIFNKVKTGRMPSNDFFKIIEAKQ